MFYLSILNKLLISVLKYKLTPVIVKIHNISSLNLVNYKEILNSTQIYFYSNFTIPSPF